MRIDAVPGAADAAGEAAGVERGGTGGVTGAPAGAPAPAADAREYTTGEAEAYRRGLAERPAPRPIDARMVGDAELRALLAEGPAVVMMSREDALRLLDERDALRAALREAIDDLATADCGEGYQTNVPDRVALMRAALAARGAEGDA